jgi:hypothetical protein
MIENSKTTKKAVADILCTAVAVAVSEIFTRLIPITFSLSFYTFSHPDPPLKPCGYCTF